MTAGRHLDWEGCHNVRDLGGLPAAGGRVTSWGAVVRSDSPPVLVHCTVGRDRGGLVSLLLLALVGVAPADIADDYELSNPPAATPRPVGRGPVPGLDPWTTRRTRLSGRLRSPTGGPAPRMRFRRAGPETGRMGALTDPGDVHVVAVRGEPEVPDPAARQPQAQRFFGPLLGGW